MRALCLHGWRTSGDILDMQLSFLRRTLGDGWQFDCPNGTFPASGPPMAAVSEFFGSDRPYFEWWDAVAAAGDLKTYTGWQETVALLSGLLRENAYDLLIGFSQGAAVVTLLTMLREHGTDSLSDQLRSCRWKANLLLCGVPPLSVDHAEILELVAKNALQTPSVHVTDSIDTLEPEHAPGHETNVFGAFLRATRHICRQCICANVPIGGIADARNRTRLLGLKLLDLYSSEARIRVCWRGQ